MPDVGEKDWAEVHRRLDSAREALRRQREHDPERERRTLEARARSLAQPLEPPIAGGVLDVVSFKLGSESYALESRYLRAVFRLSELSPIPGAQAPVFGVTPWRGELLTVLDLRQLLGVPATGLSDLSRVLVVGEARAAFGILVDAVDDLVTLPLSTIRPPAEGVAVQREFLRGITGEALIVLDAAELLRLHG